VRDLAVKFSDEVTRWSDALTPAGI
jgi:hypothetical protein